MLILPEQVGFEPRTLGFEAQSSATLATEARMAISIVPLSYAYFSSKDLPWHPILEALKPFVITRSPTLELPRFTCFESKASPLLLSNLDSPLVSPLPFGSWFWRDRLN